MRSSDWSSDVCSSDLLEVADRDAGDEDRCQQHADHAERAEDGDHHRRRIAHDVADAAADAHVVRGHGAEAHQRIDRDDDRSEEHTSELQSLMRISYAVFCLKKKQNTTHQKEYKQ